MQAWWSHIARDFYLSFIEQDRYLLYIRGFGNTVTITLFATMLGIVIGMIIAITKFLAINNKALKPLDVLCDVYIAVIRGTPVVLQLLIMYTVIFASVKNGIPIAILTFGINSGAYVAEIIRSGLLSIDKGQTEAGRSLGLTQGQTMRLIIVPQAIKNILPALFNEFIVLFKETSIAGYVAIQDLIKVAEGLKGRLFTPMPLYAVGVIYLVVVIGLTALQKKLEGRLRKSDNR
ncbi:MAG TPA: amino acid ABC transporter permease [Ruminococcaceae bacterium]|nr:amino acid ABC transporter permease [Oscillospiraceae bacterium]